MRLTAVLYTYIPFSYLLVRFLALVTTMVTKVDHGNHRSNDRGQYHIYQQASMSDKFIFCQKPHSNDSVKIR